MKTLQTVFISNNEIRLNGKTLDTQGSGLELLRYAYHQWLTPYPKFFKMDTLCKLGFVATELMLQVESHRHFDDNGHVVEEDALSDRAIILFNRHGSLHNDLAFQSTIANADDYYPSPSLFVYTLPNIVTGEIAIRNRYYGETEFIMLPHKDPVLMEQMVEDLLRDSSQHSAIMGWLDCDAQGNMEADLKIIEL